MATERIQILVTERGTRRVRREITGIGTSADRSATSVNRLQRLVVAIGSAVAVRQLIRLSDSFTQVENRLRLVTSSTEELRSVQNELFATANRTRTAFEATAELYARVALSARNLGVTQREVIQFTEALNQAVQLSGASAQEARNGIIQFAQGLAANRLAGDELRAVLEQLPLVADVIAQELGVTRGSLRDLAAQGRITASEILAAFGPETQARLRQQFSETIPTISQALTVLSNALIELIGRVNQSQGIFTALARGILFVANNFERFARGILGALVVPAIIATIAAVQTLTVALIANPFFAIIAAISVAIGLLTAFSDRIMLTEGSLVNLGDVVVGLGQEFAIAFGEAFNAINDLLGGIFQFRDTTQVTLEDVLRFVAKTADGFLGVWVGAFFALGRLFQNLPNLLGSAVFAAINGIITAIEGLINFAIRGINELNIRTVIAVNQIIDAANRASRALGAGDLLERLSARGLRIDNVQFDRLENDLGEAATNFSEAIIGGFQEGFEQVDGVQRLLDRSLARAENRASQRELERVRRQQQQTTDPLGQIPAGDTGPVDDLATIALRERIELLQRESELVRESLGLSSQQIEARRQLFDIEEQLRRKNVELTDAQREQLLSAIEQNQAYQAQAQILERVRGAALNAQFGIQQLQQLFDDGRISVDEFRSELRRLRLEELAGNQDVFSGFERGLIRIQDQISNFGAQAEQTLTNAFSGAEDALVDFVTTGEVNFSGLVDSILADLTRLLARQALFALFGGLGGGGAGGLGSFLFGGAFGGGRQEGGRVRPDQTFLVGENGPELFQPPTSGTIVPNEQLGGGGQQAPVVQIVNVTDPNEVASAMNQPEVQDTVVNVIRRNRQAVRAALGV